ncbi:hypothetical protein EMIHUDRAFT_204370 [Emiliania huxleyi CCMP1516]|uniref:N-acetyltransferase domain-containing protein n=2 Tax=Emiliania huxleyi TaxID=2903 RepID=A0A0D3JY97_EMIH1|nr:hypothetical protein EMIHUDRAFT_204370 [Emiliania huxleyi CCMP1516]EOD28482.1 hypothetical protein EMIHUDRAFT_204370 [Emiliania huxleyi CCMP1516]|eukprot:XP_005780911.1 hypothetical protein EMIHUDRAFT_204370 [Emiliania huxleyi CCMP1516]
MQAPLPRSMRPGIVVVTRDTLRALAPADAQLVRKAIDSIGELSAKAQGLSKPITSHAQMLACDNRLYLSVGKDSLRGLLRVGGRQLFVHRKQSSEYVQTSPLCVLDFFVCTALQRGGEGRALFDFMCQREGTCAAALGYDRPSHKFLAFLRKHFDLASFIPQLNHFVVLGCKERGHKSQGPLVHATGKGWVKGHKGQYYDALHRIIFNFAKEVGSPSAVDRTDYGTASGSARGFVQHHSQQLSRAAVCGDAQNINNAARIMRVAHSNKQKAPGLK